MNDTVIKVDGVSKKYCRSIKHTMLYGATDLTRSFLGLNQRTERLRDGEFWAVDDVSFELKRGETLGIIGPNGSGKSTMLKLLNGIFMPDKGKIEINGRVGALIEVGAGFHPMLTGRENIYVNGAILGMSKKEIDKKFDEIVDFADIGDFIDSPVKHYSSGMHVRLGFAIAAHSEPDILLVDEVLAVGDYRFQQKSFERIERFKEKGVSTVLVSHNLHTVRFLCDRVLVKENGRVKFLGDTNQAIQIYQGSENESLVLAETYGLNKGSDVVKIESVDIRDLNNQKREVFHSNDGVIIDVKFFSEVKIHKPVIQFGLYRDDGLPCFAGNTLLKEHNIKQIEGNGHFSFKINRLHLNSGKYRFAFIFFSKSMTAPYGADLKGDIIVTSDYPRTGKSCPAFSVDYEWIAC